MRYSGILQGGRELSHIHVPTPGQKLNGLVPIPLSPLCDALFQCGKELPWSSLPFALYDETRQIKTMNNNQRQTKSINRNMIKNYLN